jgi:GalNAc-alpha-(1->4)-GalNAc-alpha-(1->3)-diNAcBac-PP-undecaprenol alpha-1,4-N-acetyl-D-galactosaminyltransferase
MRLLFAIKSLNTTFGGAERVLCLISSELAKRGHDISLITFDKPGGKSLYNLEGCIKRIDIGIGNSSQASKFYETLKRIRYLREIIKAEKPDVVIGFMHSMFIPLAFALIGIKIPILGSEHIVPEHYKGKYFEYFLLIFSTFFLSRITVLSCPIRGKYPYYVRKKMVVMPNPVLKKKLINYSVKTTKPELLILSIGRLDEQKDHATLIEAFGLISDFHPNWRLKIIGDGHLRKNLERLIVDNNLSLKVSMPGVTADILTEYNKASIFVTPSRYESFGLVTAEAMIHSLPVIGFSDCPGTNELILHNKTGILVNPGNSRVESLSLELLRLIASSRLRAKLGKAGHDFINEKFSNETVCDKWEYLLLSLRENFLSSKSFFNGCRS